MSAFSTMRLHAILIKLWSRSDIYASRSWVSTEDKAKPILSISISLVFVVGYISLLSPRRRVMGVVILSFIIAIYNFERFIRP